MTYEEEPNIFSETDITPEEYVQDAIKQERLAFADWLKKLIEIDYITGHIHREQYFIENIKAKEKQLRSNPLPKQSVDGKGSGGR